MEAERPVAAFHAFLPSRIKKSTRPRGRWAGESRKGSSQRVAEHVARAAVAQLSTCAGTRGRYEKKFNARETISCLRSHGAAARPDFSQDAARRTMGVGPEAIAGCKSPDIQRTRVPNLSVKAQPPWR